MKNLILESLQNLNRRLATDLFEDLIESGDFVERDKIDDSLMFIFPDGRLLGAADTYIHGRYGTDVDRDLYHGDLYELIDYDRHPNIGLASTHPMVDIGLAEQYNLIIVAAVHQAETYLIPPHVEPTPEQVARFAELERAGYTRYVEPQDLWNQKDPYLDN